MRLKLAAILLIAAASAGCASSDPDRMDAKAPRKCGISETYSCIERMGEPVRCFCADKDTLRELLEPTIE